MSAKPKDIDLYTFEIEQKQRLIRVVITAKDPLEALDLTHAVIFHSQTFKTCKAKYKMIPPKENDPQ